MHQTLGWRAVVRWCGPWNLAAVLAVALGGQAAALDIGNYVIKQSNAVATFTIPAGTTVDAGGYVVVGRNATKAQFESNYGLTLATNVVYLNAANVFPSIDGSEQFGLYNSSGTLIDGFSSSGVNPYNASIQRKSAVSNATKTASWLVLAEASQTAGSGGAGNGAAGLVVNEYTDNRKKFSYEFVELYYDFAVTNVPPVLAPIGAQAIAISNTLTVAVTATPTDGDPVTLTVSNAPAGSSFSASGASGTFYWTNAAPMGVYTARFYAADNDGNDWESVVISVVPLPEIFFQAPESSIVEDGGTQAVVVVVSRAANASAQVLLAGGTATYGTNQDYSVLATTVTFTASGSTQQTVRVKINNDSATEGGETVVLLLTNAVAATVGTPAQHTVTIRDNDAITIMSCNLVSGYPAVYRDPGCRVIQALKPDIMGVQEFNITNASYRAFVDVNFGTNYSYYVEPQATNFFPQPNGMVSRWPITASGEWADPITVNRDFAWATIDIPGDRNLHLVVAHLYYSGTEEDRETEARALTNYIRQAGFPANDYVVIAADLNTLTYTEPCLAVLTNIVSDRYKPCDQNGDIDTSKNRDQRFDYVLPTRNLDSNHYTVVVSGSNFVNGLVFDTRLWSPVPPPALAGDSSATGNAHMAVMKAFSIGRTPPNLQPIGAPTVKLGEDLVFDVTASATDGDSVTLTASNLPPGASFSATGGSGTFTWSNAAPLGVYTTRFYAADVDGVEDEIVGIRVLVNGEVWINEIHYDNASTDTNEGVEVAGTAGMDLSYYMILGYNGGDGATYISNTLAGVIDDEGCGYGAVWVDMPDLQNGPDALALVNHGTSVVQFLSYEGAVVATEGPAIEMTATDLGVDEAGTETAKSLQLTGTGTNYAQFAWAGPSNTASRGVLNTLQAIYPCGSGSNQPPVLTPIGARSVVQSNDLVFAVSASDADGDPITLTASNLPAGASFSAAAGSGTFTWTNARPIGVVTCRFYAADHDGFDSEAVLINVVSGAEPPVLAAIGAKSVIVNHSLGFAVSATDAENDPITLTVSNAPAGSVFNTSGSTGAFTWASATPVGVYTSRFYAVDDDGRDFETVVITVAAATNRPVLQPIGPQWIAVSNELVFGVTATDVDDDVITLTASNLPPGASFSAVAGSGTFTWTNARPIGVYTSRFYATDNDGRTAETVTIRVIVSGNLWFNELHYDNAGTDTNEGVEVAGSAGMDLGFYAIISYNGLDGKMYASNALSGYMPDEGCGFGAVWVPIEGLQNGPDGLALVYQGQSAVAFYSYEGAFYASNGPAAGSISMDIKVKELGLQTNCSLQLMGVGREETDFLWSGPTNAASPGLLNAMQTIYPCGGSTNQPPVLTPVGDRVAVESNSLSFSVSAWDYNGDAITLTASNLPAGATFTPAGATGAFAWASAAPIGVYTTLFYAADDDGVDWEAVRITVLPVATNPPYFYTVGSQTVYELQTLSFQVVARDPDNEPVTITASNLPAGAGFLATGATGTFTWVGATPLGVYTAVFYVADNDGFDVEYVPITVAPATAVPVLAPIGNRTVALNGTLNFTVTAADADNDPISLTASNLPSGAGFLATGATGTFTWAGAAPVGVYTSTFHAAGDDGSDGETIQIEVAAGSVWINELHYDNTGTDTNEGVEVAGPAGTDLSGYAIIGYNGPNGLMYSSNALSGVIPDAGCGYGAIWTPIVGLQNGDPDGVALVRYGTELVQFLSYDGAMTASNGPAAGVTVASIGSESTTLAIGKSLQLCGTGNAYSQFAWGITNATPGALNATQTISPCGGGNDTDGDGLPDDWETLHFGGVTNAQAAADTDHDTLDNYGEYVAMTDPTNGQSVFALASQDVAWGTNRVYFNTATNRFYTLFLRTNLFFGPWEILQSNLPGTGGNLSILLTNQPVQVYYRTRVQLP